jgi:hypothetical protein
MRRLAVTALVVVGGFLVGNGLAALPAAENDPCTASARPADLAEGTSYRSSMRIWPLGTRCEYENGYGESHVESYGPSVPQALLWVLIATAVLAAAVLRPASSVPRGAAAGLVIVAVFAWLYGLTGEVGPAGLGALVLGAPLVAAVDRLLPAREPRSPLAWLVTAPLVAFVVLLAWALPWLMGQAELAVAVACAAGVLTSAGASRLLAGPRPAAGTS